MNFTGRFLLTLALIPVLVFSLCGLVTAFGGTASEPREAWPAVWTVYAAAATGTMGTLFWLAIPRRRSS